MGFDGLRAGLSYVALRVFCGLEGIGDKDLVFGVATDDAGRNVGPLCLKPVVRDFDRSLIGAFT